MGEGVVEAQNSMVMPIVVASEVALVQVDACSQGSRVLLYPAEDQVEM